MVNCELEHCCGGIYRQMNNAVAWPIVKKKKKKKKKKKEMNAAIIAERNIETCIL